MDAPKSAVITGGGSGVGRAVATAMMAAGYRVALAGRRREALEETAAAGGEALVVPTDVTSAASVQRLFETVAESWGRVDVLFNNAGSGGAPGRVDELSPADWQAIVEVNLTGPFLCAHHAFDLMRRQDPRGGRIINNGSISAHVPRPGSVGYTTTKHAITGLTKSIALDGRAFDIACGQIDIGNAGTDMTQRMHTGARQADGHLAPEPTFDVSHVAEAVLFMAGLPLDTNVQFITISATTMPYIGRG